MWQVIDTLPFYQYYSPSLEGLTMTVNDLISLLQKVENKEAKVLARTLYAKRFVGGAYRP